MENHQLMFEGMIQDVSVRVADNVGPGITFICVDEQAAKIVKQGLNEVRIGWELNDNEVFFQLVFGEQCVIKVKSTRITNDKRLFTLLKDKQTYYLGYAGYKDERNEIVRVSETGTSVAVSPSSMLSAR